MQDDCSQKNIRKYKGATPNTQRAQKFILHTSKASRTCASALTAVKTRLLQCLLQPDAERKTAAIEQKKKGQLCLKLNSAFVQMRKQIAIVLTKIYTERTKGIKGHGVKKKLYKSDTYLLHKAHYAEGLTS